jgi:UDP-glucose 4-epimerase
MKRVVVTGALGYLGTKLIEKLAAVPQLEILAIDRVDASRPDVMAAVSRGRVRVVDGDILELPLDRYFEHVTTVYHLAADVPPATGSSDPASMYRINVDGTRRVAEACADQGCHLIYPSTTSVYAKSGGTVLEADAHKWLGPQTPYAESVFRAESGLRDFAALSGLTYHVVRLGSLFGVSTGMHFRNAVQSFCLEAVATGRVTVWESGLHQRRPYCHVDDAARVLMFLARDRQLAGTMVHAASHHETASTIVDVIRAYRTGLDIRTIAHESMNHFSYDVSCQRLARAGFQFQGSLRRGVAQVIQRTSTVDRVATH